MLGYFGRWLVLHGYLERGTDLVEGVQRYSMKSGEIHIFTPAEVSKLIEHANDRLLPYLVIAGFAGLRGAEIQRLDWCEMDLQDGFIEVTAQKSKTDARRLVPIKPYLNAWLQGCAEEGRAGLSVQERCQPTGEAGEGGRGDVAQERAAAFLHHLPCGRVRRRRARGR